MILLPIHKDTKVSFHYAVLLFCLSIYLRMKCDGESSLDAKKVVERRLELGCKNCSSVTDDGV